MIYAQSPAQNENFGSTVPRFLGSVLLRKKIFAFGEHKFKPQNLKPSGAGAIVAALAVLASSEARVVLRAANGGAYSLELAHRID